MRMEKGIKNTENGNGGIQMEILRQMQSAVWGPWLLWLFLGTGVFLTVKLKGFQFVGIKVWWNATAGSLWRGEKRMKSQLFTSCTALAATVGTGNIVGVATALTAGGPGAVFWMWISAFLGMATAYAEVFLGIRYRHRNEDGTWIGGPFAYLEAGFGNRFPGIIYALFCVLASLGMGSMVQANSMADSLRFSFSIPAAATALAAVILTAAVIFGGMNRIEKTASLLVPFSAGLYLFFGIIAVLSRYENIPSVLGQILNGAFCPESVAGGAAGYGISQAVRNGVARGVFSNEAGLGSLSVLHSLADDKATPKEQGMWAVFEVFFDTIVSCTLTAFVILCLWKPEEGYSGSSLVAACFSRCYGWAGGMLTGISMTLFGFATIIAWFYLGKQAVDYLAHAAGGIRVASGLYGILYLGAVFCGCVGRLEAVWLFSDIFNGLMAVPNLLCILRLSGQIKLSDM